MSSFDQAADRINAAVEKAEIGSEILSQVANGDEFTEVPTTSGPVPSLKKWLKDNMDLISGGVIARVDKAILSYPDYAAASAAAATLPDGQVVNAEGYEYSVVSGSLDPESPAASVSDVDTIADLRALPAPKKKCVIYVRGYYAANDGGCGYFQWVPASSKPDNGGNVISPSGSPSTGRWEWGGEIVGKRFGIRADGIADDGSRLQAAIDAASSGPGLVLLPEGFIYKPATTGPVLPKNGVTLRGMGRGKTILKHDDITGTFRYLGTTSPAGACASFAMEDLTVEGMWSTSLNSNGVQMVELWYIDDLRLHNVGARNSRAMGITGRHCKKVSITKCDIYRTNGDGIAFWDCDIIDVSNNTLEDCNDDCISLHTNDATAPPSRQQVTILGNRIRTSQGIKVLGAKNAVIGYNSMSRMYAYAFYVNSDAFFHQGDTPNHSFSIIGNVVNDVFRRVQGGAGDQYYIRVGGGQRNAGPLAAAPGMPDTSTGTIISLFGSGIGSFQAQNTDDTSVASPGGYFINVSSNTFARTLPAVASVDQWGFGQLFSADHGAGFYNGPITEADLQTEAIVLDPYINSALIENNIVATTGNALRFNIDSVVDMAYIDVMIRVNKFRDFKDYGVRWPLGTFTTQRISIHDNEFDADPRLVHANRGANGTWATSGLPSSVYAAVVGGLDIRRNGFRNTCQPVTVGGSAVVNLEANLLFCDPAAIGFNTSNKGIGVTPRAGNQYQYVMEGSDPASATFGKLLNATLLDSNALPTTGKYMPGHIVRNTNPSVAGSAGSQYIITGWLRTSLGSGHALNTDWRELRSLTGT